MALKKIYSRVNWENSPSINTPLNENNLNRMDNALNEIDNRVVGLDATKMDKTELNTLVADITFDETTGIFTITRVNGTSISFDTKLEKIAVNFDYDILTNELVLTLDDGSKMKVDLSALIKTVDFEASSTISITLQENGKFKFDLVKNSITDEYLQPNYLADIQNESSSAQLSSTSASQSASMALQAKEDAEKARDEAVAISNVGVATSTTAGIVKPDGTSIEIDETGTISVKEIDTNIVNYNNSTSKLTATNVQSAIDELNANTNNSLFIEEDEKNITFGKNGDGDYGYYKADGSFVPFKTGNGVDFLSLAPEFDDNETYTHDSIVLKDNDLYQYIGNEDTFNGVWDDTKWIMVMIPDISKSNGDSSGGGSEPTPEPTPTDLEPVLLWTNPSPSATFTAQTIELDLSEYAGVLVELTDSSTIYHTTGYIKVGEEGAIGTTDNYSPWEGGMGRSVAVTSTGVAFRTAYSGTSAANRHCIPYKIYGVKGVVVEQLTATKIYGESVNATQVQTIAEAHANNATFTFNFDFKPKFIYFTYAGAGQNVVKYDVENETSTAIIGAQTTTITKISDTSYSYKTGHTTSFIDVVIAYK